MYRPRGRSSLCVSLCLLFFLGCKQEGQDSVKPVVGTENASTGGAPPTGKTGPVVGFGGGGDAPVTTGGSGGMPVETCGSKVCTTRQECQDDVCVDVFCETDEHCP